MNSTSRDTILRMMLPALGIVAVYYLAFNRDGELRAARAALEASRAAAVDMDDLTPVRAKLASTSAEQQQVAGEKKEADARWSQLAALPAGSSIQRNAALRQLTQMLWDQGLYPFDESPAESNGEVPASFDEMLKKLSTGGMPAPKRLWKIRFYGRYEDVAQTLAAMGDLDAPLVPISLTMSEASPDTPWRIWTLILWV